jgi:NAD(P)-dependent dehydrogenase (short-subunit alcohol dehydrogenase family)
MAENGKAAFVTGAGSGIGRATALALVRTGYAVGVLGDDLEDVIPVADELKSLGGNATALRADISVESEMRKAVDHLVAQLGRLDVIIANGVINGVSAPIDDLKPEERDRTIAVNLRGTYLTIHVTVPHLKSAGGRSIVMISSINGTRTFATPGAIAYTATKAGQVAMVQQLALELAKHHIRINAACPGEIETNIDDNTSLRGEEETAIPVVWPEGQVPITGGAPERSEDVANVIVILCSARARHITGSPLWIDGGQGLLR